MNLQPISESEAVEAEASLDFSQSQIAMPRRTLKPTSSSITVDLQDRPESDETMASTTPIFSIPATAAPSTGFEKIFTELPPISTQTNQILTGFLAKTSPGSNLNAEVKLVSLDMALRSNRSAVDTISILIKSNSWRTLSEFCKMQIVSNDRQLDITTLWYLRFMAQMKLRFFKNALEEMTALFPLLKSSNSLSRELNVLYAILPSLNGQHTESINRLYEIMSSTNDASFLKRLKMLTVNVLLETKDFFNARKLLKELVKTIEAEGDTNNSAEINSLFGRVLIQLGNIHCARTCFNRAEEILQSHNSGNAELEQNKHDLIMMNRALLAIGSGDWTAASTILTTLISSNPQNMIAMNNLCICMLYIGKLQESISLLQSIVLRDASDVCLSEPLLFNLTTLYELASEKNMDQKKRIFECVIQRAGDSFQAECLKI